MKDEKNGGGGGTRLRKGVWLEGWKKISLCCVCVCNVIGQMMGWGRREKHEKANLIGYVSDYEYHSGEE